MKKLGLFIIVGLLSMTIPQMNVNTFTVQAATIKKVTGIKKNRVKSIMMDAIVKLVGKK